MGNGFLRHRYPAGGVNSQGCGWDGEGGLPGGREIAAGRTQTPTQQESDWGRAGQESGFRGHQHLGWLVACVFDL